MARQCNGTTKGGAACKRPPSRDSEYCLAHDPARVEDHAAISLAGGLARQDEGATSLKAEVRELMEAMRGGVVSAGVGSVLLQGFRFLRELDAAARLESHTDTLVESIQALRAAGPPDMSEPDTSEAANIPTGGIPDEPPAPYDPDAPKWENYQSAEAFIRDSHAHKAVPLGHLSVAERRARWQSGQRSGA